MLFDGSSRHYLRELGRVIKPGGRAVITYFLLDDESPAFVAKDMDVVQLKVNWDGDPLCRVANLEVPESATAHDEARVRAYTAEAGFSVGEIIFGNSCGRPGGGLQDGMVLTRTQANVRPWPERAHRGIRALAPRSSIRHR